MKNKRETIAFAALNAAISHATTIEIDVPITYTYSTQPDGTANTQTLYPAEIQIINNSGTEIEFLVISNALEYAEYLVDQTNYAFIRLPDSGVLQEQASGLNRIYKFFVRKNTFGSVGTATVDLCIEFTGYRYKN